MNRMFRERIIVTLLVTLLAAALGTLAGYLLGREISLQLAQRKLWEDSDRMIAISETFSKETRTALAQINGAPFQFCSEAEMSFVRTLIFQSHFLKDGGRMVDGRIVCSATLRGVDLPQAQMKPDFVQPDGTLLYRNQAPLIVRNLRAVVVQSGSAYVVYTPHLMDLLTVTTSRFMLVATSDPSLVPTSESSADPARMKQLQINQAISHEGNWRVDDTFYATRCSARYFKCVSANISIHEALHNGRRMLAIFSAGTGVIGALLGFLFLLFYFRNRGMEQQLRRAIRRDKLRIFYQPIVNLDSKRIVGAEALARWTDEEGFAVGPDVFVRIAEERGFVGEITELVVRHVLRDMGESLRRDADFRISINVAAADLTDPNFLPMLEEELRKACVPADQLAIEITESCTARQEVAEAAILQLRQKGHSIHIDDFGTGYSSLSYLHKLSIDAIKIDRSFTQAVGTQAVTLSILPQILSMAQALKLQVIVEGVETREQAEYFLAMTDSGTILAQGWLFGRPAAVEAFCQLIENQEQKLLAVANVA